MKRKTLTDVRDSLLEAFLELEHSYLNSHLSEEEKLKAEYLKIEMCEHILNSMKSLEHHYREFVPEMRTFKRECSELEKARKLIKKYGEKTPEKIVLKREFDSGGYLEHRDFFEEIPEQRKLLKKNFPK